MQCVIKLSVTSGCKSIAKKNISAIWRLDVCLSLIQVRLAALAAAKHTYAPQAAQQKKGAAERSRPGLTA